MSSRRPSSAALLATLLFVGACSDVAAPTQPSPGRPLLSGGSTGIDGSTFLPQTAPAPGILIRESFGPGVDIMRPAGGKGLMRTDYVHTTINGFWVEYPGSKSTAWIATETGQTWKFCAGGDNTSTENPWELPSPLQTTQPGCVVAAWNESDPITQLPTALLPITVALPSDGYELSMEGYPAPIPEGYVAIGFTNSGAVTSNLTTSGILWLRVTDTTRFGVPLHYELRAGSLTAGRLLASGDAGAAGWNHMALRVSPTAGTVTLTFADTVAVTVPFTMTAPKYLAFEGVGILDDFVLRQ